MRILERTEGSVTILALHGRVDFGTRAIVKAAIAKVKQKQWSHIVLNVEEVTHMDHTGLGWIVLTHQYFRRGHCQMSIVKPPQLLRNMLDRTGISQLIPVYDSEAAALADMAITGQLSEGESAAVSVHGYSSRYDT